MRRTKSMVWSLSPSLDVKRFWPTESLTAQATEKTMTQGGVGCIYEIYSVFKSKLPETLFSIKKKDPETFFLSKTFIFFRLEVFHPIRSCFSFDGSWDEIFQPAETPQEMRTWLTLLVVNILSSMSVNPWVWRPLPGFRRQDALLACCMDKIWCTFTSWYYGEHISHGKNEVFFCFILAGSCQIFVHVCPKENLTVNFFWETFLFGQWWSMSMFFFAFLKLVEPAPTEYLFFFFYEVFNAVNVDVSKFKDYTSRSDPVFFLRKASQHTHREASRYKRVIVGFPPGSPKKGKWVVFLNLLQPQMRCSRQEPCHLQGLEPYLGTNHFWQGGDFCGIFRDASVIESMGSVSKLFFLAPVKLTNHFEQTFLDRLWEGCGGGASKTQNSRHKYS